MTGPTGADREKANRIVSNWLVNFSADDTDPLIAMIETHLAAERAQARRGDVDDALTAEEAAR